MSIDLALVFPRTQYLSGDPPLGLASLAATAREAGFSVAIVDGTWHPSVLWMVDEINRLDPRVVGIYCSSLMLMDAFKVAARLRVHQWDSHQGRAIVMGGPHVTVCREEMARYGWAVDHFVTGEGELPLLQILRGEEPTPSTPDLTQLPAPALDLLDMKKYLVHWHYGDSVRMGMPGTNLLSSRGCAYKCSFCQPTLDKMFGHRLRCRTPEQVTAEMEDLHERYGITSFFFHDDTLTANHPWLEGFGRAIDKMSFFPIWGCNSRVNTLTEKLIHRMSVYGCCFMHLGIESGSQRVLDEIYQKGIKLDEVRQVVEWLRHYRVHTGAFFMLGAPGETLAEMQATVDLACSLPLDEASFSLVVPLPGTTLYDRMGAEGQPLSGQMSTYDYYRNQPFQSALPIQELRQFQRAALLRFYRQRKGYIARHFTSLSGIRRLWQKGRRFV